MWQAEAWLRERAERFARGRDALRSDREMLGLDLLASASPRPWMTGVMAG